jgi:hypothetical protein
MKGGYCNVDIPVCVLVSPFRSWGGRVEWRWWCVLWCPRVRIGSSPSCCPCLSCITRPSLCSLSQHCWLGGVFVTGGRHCGIAVMVCVWVGRAASGGVHGLVACLLCFPLPLPLCVGVRGSARAALRARTLSPNTIAFPCRLLFSSLHPRLSLTFRLSSDVEWRWGSPCVGVLCWHDGYG